MSPSGSGTGSVCRCPAGALPPALEVESVCVCARTHGSTRTPTHLRARDTHTLLNITIFNPVLSLLKLCLEQYFRPEMESGLRFGPVLNDVVWTAPSLVCVGGRMGAFPWVLPAQWQSWFASGVRRALARVLSAHRCRRGGSAAPPALLWGFRNGSILGGNSAKSDFPKSLEFGGSPLLTSSVPLKCSI